MAARRRARREGGRAGLRAIVIFPLERLSAGTRALCGARQPPGLVPVAGRLPPRPGRSHPTRPLRLMVNGADAPHQAARRSRWRCGCGRCDSRAAAGAGSREPPSQHGLPPRRSGEQKDCGPGGALRERRFVPSPARGPGEVERAGDRRPAAFPGGGAHWRAGAPWMSRAA
jgi:hypothetical protein